MSSSSSQGSDSADFALRTNSARQQKKAKQLAAAKEKRLIKKREDEEKSKLSSAAAAAAAAARAAAGDDEGGSKKKKRKLAEGQASVPAPAVSNAAPGAAAAFADQVKDMPEDLDPTVGSGPLAAASSGGAAGSASFASPAASIVPHITGAARPMTIAEMLEEGEVPSHVMEAAGLAPDAKPEITVTKVNDTRTLRDFQVMIMWILGEGVLPTWAVVRHISLITKVVVVAVPGLGSLDYIKHKKCLAATAKTLGDPLKVIAPGTKNRLHATLHSFLNTPKSNAMKKKQAASAPVPAPVTASSAPLPSAEYYVLTEAYLNSHRPICSCMRK